MTTPAVDPWAGTEKTPAVSFADAAVGTVRTLVITEKARLVQSRDYLSGEPKFWPTRNPGETPSPVMSLVITGTDENGEPRALWAQRPSAMLAALVEAKRTSPTHDLEIGGKLEIKFVGEKPNETNPRLNPTKLYAVRYTPPTPAVATSDVDPWAAEGQPEPAF